MIEVRMPEAGFSITEGTVIEWHKKIGDTVKEGENVVSVETDKITVDLPAEGKGVLQEVRYNEGEVVPVGDVLGIIAESGEKISESPEKESPEKESPEKESPEKSIKKDADTEIDHIEIVADTGSASDGRKISPAARATARVHGIDISGIREGTGPGGRIVKKDVLSYLEKIKGKEAKRIVTEQKVLRVGLTGREERRVEFTGWRKVIAGRMVKSTIEVPHYMMSVEADVTELRVVIDRLRAREGLHVTYLPFMMKAIEAGIEDEPLINAWCDGNGYTIKKDLNIGIAVDLGEKLLVPVVKDVSGKSVLELTKELEELVRKTREENLETADVEGGTITLTNVGMFATTYATSVIVQPQVAIVYMGAVTEAPGIQNGAVAIRKKMTFGATFDHRVVNGAAGGRFLKRVKECLEDIGELVARLR